MLKSIATAGVILGVVLATGITQAAAYHPYPLSKSQTAIIKQTISEAMPDPASAQFRGIAAVTNDREVVVCGFFNGKNQLGGYAGFEPFVGVLTEGFKIGNYGDGGSNSVAVAHVCRGYGFKM